MKTWHLYSKARRVASRVVASIIESPATGVNLTTGDNESPAVRKIARIFSDPGTRASLYSEFEKIDSREATLRLRQAIRRRERERFLKRSTAAAAIVTFLLGSVMLISPPSSPPSDMTIPGKPRAVLIMSNGEQVELAELTRMNEMDGTAIIQDQEGELVYQPDSSVSRTPLYNTIMVPRHGEYSLVLADGSRVKLNSGSELRYPVVFSGNQREVFLKGEAYLEVSPGEHPFIVHAYDARVQVYGTQFNINSYNPEKINVVLVEGKVGISSGQGNEIILYPNQLARVDARLGISVKKNINTDYHVAWQNGYFAFEDERLEDILTTLSRWYNFEVSYSQEALKDIRFTASLSRKQPLKNILEHFRKTGSISYRVHDTRILIE